MRDVSLTAHELKNRHRRVRDSHPEALRVRVHRSISWLERAELAGEDADARFVFLWIAFNAAYASDESSCMRAVSIAAGYGNDAAGQSPAANV